MQNTRSNEYVIKSHIFTFHILELVSGNCCLMPTQHFFPQLYHGENKLIFNEMMMRSALY